MIQIQKETSKIGISLESDERKEQKKKQQTENEQNKTDSRKSHLDMNQRHKFQWNIE